MAAPAAGPAGGFLTGVNGIFIFLLGLGVIGGLVVVGLNGQANTFVELDVDQGTRFERATTTFGAELYFPRCMRNSSTFDTTTNWQHAFTLADGSTITEVQLGGTANALILKELGNVDANFTWARQPHTACLSVCLTALDDDCTWFTYEGTGRDSCQFLSPGTPVPEIIIGNADDPLLDHYVYNATCMQEERERILSQFDSERVDLVRPNQGPPARGNAVQLYMQSLTASLRFLITQWAGVFPTALMNQVAPNTPQDASVEPDDGVGTWKKRGFDGACGLEALFNGRGGVGSFAGGDHFVSTMGVAHELAELALSRLWWRQSFDADPTVKQWVDSEIVHQAVFLVTAAQTGADEGGGILVGVGDQMSDTGDLLAYGSFSAADRALAVGPPTFEGGQNGSVAPACTYSTEDQPTADVAAAAAAALSMAHESVRLYTNDSGLGLQAAMLEQAERLLDYSLENAPIENFPAGPYPGVDTHTADEPSTFGITQVFTLSRARDVHAHQLWAACSLWQTTGEMRYWNLTLQLYEDTIIANQGLAYFPLLNYRNPAWYGIMCIAQSAPQYSGFEQRDDLPVNDEAFLSRLFRNGTAFEPGTRGQAEQFIFQHFIFPWYTSQASFTRGRVLTFKDNFRHSNLTIDGSDEPVEGMLRDSVAAANLALMYADLPGISDERSLAARCFAKQQVDYVLGNAGNEFSYQVGVAAQGSEFPRDVWHKDAGCPPLSVRQVEYDQLFQARQGQQNAVFPRECDYVTFAGGAPSARCAVDSANAAPCPNPPQNRYRPNDFLVNGALVSWFQPDSEADGGYRDSKYQPFPEVSVGQEAPLKEQNQAANVRIDYNSALAGAVAGVAALPATFYAEECPSAAQAARAEFSATADQVPV